MTQKFDQDLNQAWILFSLPIGHFRVAFCLIFKTSLRAKPFK